MSTTKDNQYTHLLHVVKTAAIKISCSNLLHYCEVLQMTVSQRIQSLHDSERRNYHAHGMVP